MPPLEFDDAWASRLTGRYRAVFDSPTIDDGTGIFNAVVYMQGFETMYKIGDADVNAVLVVRHKAVPMALDDSIWRRYALGKYTGVKDPATDRWSARNPYWRSASGNGEDAAYTLEGLQQRGAVLLACALATQGLASILAERTRQAPGLVFDEFRRHLLPGFELQPSGIFAIMRAQDAGCHYMRST